MHVMMRWIGLLRRLVPGAFALRVGEQAVVDGAPEGLLAALREFERTQVDTVYR